MAGGAAKLLVSLSCPLPLQRTHPPPLLVCCFFVLSEMGDTSTAFGRLKYFGLGSGVERATFGRILI